MTIDEAIAILTKAKEEIGGDKCLILCLVNSGIEDADVNTMRIINNDLGEYVSVLVDHPAIQDN